MRTWLTLDVAQRYFALPIHQRQAIANWLKVERATLESDAEYYRRVMLVAGTRGLVREFVRRVNNG